LSQLTLDQANQIIQGARSAARAANYKPMGIAVLDASGQLVAFGREDGASMFRFDVARGKAWGAVGMGSSSRVLAERAKDNPNFFYQSIGYRRRQIFASTGRCLDQRRARQCTGSRGCQWRNG